jgi:hypothetical protein
MVEGGMVGAEDVLKLDMAVLGVERKIAADLRVWLVALARRFINKQI